jgi:putative ABC transport system permease protein
MMILSREFLILILISNLLAWPLAYLVTNKLMASYAYRTDISLLIFFGAAFLTLLLTFLTISIQTLKATRINPVEALRYE